MPRTLAHRAKKWTRFFHAPTMRGAGSADTSAALGGHQDRRGRNSPRHGTLRPS